MSTWFALTEQPIVVATPERQPIFLSSDVSGFDSIDLQVTCFIEGTAAGATIGLITSMQMESEDGWLAVPDGFVTLSGSGLQFTRITIGAGMLRYLRWEVSSLAGATGVTIFLTGVARSLLSTGEPWQRGLISWHAAKSWAEVYAEILAAGGNATVVCGDGYASFATGAFTIPPGEYDINDVRFFCVGDWGFVLVEDGATFALRSGSARFVLDGVVFYTRGAIVASGAQVTLWLLNGGGISHDSNTGPAFPDLALSGIVATGFSRYALLWSFGSQPAIEMASSEVLSIFAQGPISMGDAVIGGSGEVYAEGDPLAMMAISASMLAGTTTFQAGSPAVYKTALATYTNASRPSASSVTIGTLIFNTDDNFPNVSDGTNWRDMSGAIT